MAKKQIAGVTALIALLVVVVSYLLAPLAVIGAVGLLMIAFLNLSMAVYVGILGFFIFLVVIFAIFVHTHIEKRH